jgi:hypothetical protein
VGAAYRCSGYEHEDLGCRADQIFAVIVIIGAFIMVCTGRWYATAGMLIGIIGAAKAEEIAAYFGIG